MLIYKHHEVVFDIKNIAMRKLYFTLCFVVTLVATNCGNKNVQQPIATVPIEQISNDTAEIVTDSVMERIPIIIEYPTYLEIDGIYYDKHFFEESIRDTVIDGCHMKYGLKVSSDIKDMIYKEIHYANGETGIFRGYGSIGFIYRNSPKYNDSTYIYMDDLRPYMMEIDQIRTDYDITSVDLDSVKNDTLVFRIIATQMDTDCGYIYLLYKMGERDSLVLTYDVLWSTEDDDPIYYD